MTISSPNQRFHKKAKIWRVPTPESLANAALAYVSRYAASEASFRRVLANKIRRAAMGNAAFGQDRAAQEALMGEIEKLVEKYKRSGVLNDAAFAEMKVASMRRAGTSARRLSQKLSVKGIDAPLIERALEEHAELAGGDTERAAAMIFAKKKRLGPFRKPQEDPERERVAKRKEIASMLRAGFSFDLVKEILGTDPEELPPEF